MDKLARGIALRGKKRPDKGTISDKERNGPLKPHKQNRTLQKQKEGKQTNQDPGHHSNMQTRPEKNRAHGKRTKKIHQEFWEKVERQQVHNIKPVGEVFQDEGSHRARMGSRNTTQPERQRKETMKGVPSKKKETKNTNSKRVSQFRVGKKGSAKNDAERGQAVVYKERVQSPVGVQKAEKKKRKNKLGETWNGISPYTNEKRIGTKE